jgi:CHAT domain-containing protein
MKKSELEDYFQNRCDISATPINLKKTDIHAAALYPISLADRLEIIVYTSEGLQRFTSKVTAKSFEKQARLLASNLRNYADFSQSKIQAQLLYQWLLAPANAYLKQHQIETLIYMPDGALRLVPLAALYDGKKFVIQDYAVVTSPGMSLIDSDSFDRKNSMLLAGMSVPGDVVSDLPEALLEDLVAATPEKGANRSLTRDLKRSVNPALKRELSVAQQEEKTRKLHELLKKPLVLESLQHLLALPGVDTEIKQLAEQNHTAYLLNESFSLQNFIQILQEQPHDTLHIASHGFFGSTAEESFIMTHDKILNLNQLEALLSSDYFKLHPIDLLTLSACQTAEGDDRSPLGISGVAIKAKVHSALGSLWPVADEATAQLMTTFYQSMNKPQQTKAKALQEAMLGILAQKNFASPSFWSPFILIGNWM